VRVRVPAAKTETLRQHTGKKIILGLRPEALHPASGADGAEFTFDANVEVVEPLGSEILLDVRVGECPMVARVEPSLRVAAHDRVRLAFDPARVHFFDAGTEASI
jgi:multiple sugar transport system ATP-binding protein